MTAPIITFLSDYGLSDDFVGVCHGVIAGVCPEARVIDLTHGIPRHDVRAGALVLAGALAYLPRGIHLAVVDPGVGSERRAVAIACADGRLLVGPDNGLLTLAAEQAGGVTAAVDLDGSPWGLPRVSATFHGRDVFAPAAAHLAGGASLSDGGPAVDPASLEVIRIQDPRLQDDGALAATVRYVDAFGNLQLQATAQDLASTGAVVGSPVTIRLPDGTDHEALYARTFADGQPGELVIYVDSADQLAVALVQDHGADRLGLEADARLQITA